MRPQDTIKPKGKVKDSRRWVILTLRNIGATEAQFPLPVTHNGIRISFDRDVPTMAPAFFYDIIKGASIPRFEKVGNTKQNPAETRGATRSADEVVACPVGYMADIKEIPDQFQTLAGIEELEQLLSDEATAPEGFDEYVGTRIGPRETPPHSADWSRELEAKAALAKPPEDLKKK